ncbi:unnamed protein product [Mytilus coruscus]|uniref:Uncharacterized protein n=1 Tax=Mytilus coruscus TaxID=42192 RepID=A0A6J8EMK5_MYTCO|nr:unnamed protein product [Mytilus coruscus]
MCSLGPTIDARGISVSPVPAELRTPIAIPNKTDQRTPTLNRNSRTAPEQRTPSYSRPSTPLHQSSQLQDENKETSTVHSMNEESEVWFISHQPSWQSLKFKEYKSKLDIKYIENCSTKSRRLLMKRTIGDQYRKPIPEIPGEMQWMVKDTA